MKRISPFLIFVLVFCGAKNGFTQVPEFADVPLVKGVFEDGLFYEDHFIAVSDYGLAIYSLDAQNPEVVDLIYLPYFGGETHLVVGDEVLFVGQANRVFSIDISTIQNSGAPEILQEIPGAKVVDVDLIDNYLFVVDENESGLQVFDVSDVSNPSLVTDIAGSGFRAVEVSPSYVYLTGNNALKRYSFSGSNLEFIDQVQGTAQETYFHADVNDTLAVIKVGPPTTFPFFEELRFFDFSIEGSPSLLTDMQISGVDVGGNPPTFFRGSEFFIAANNVLRIFSLSDYNVEELQSIPVDNVYLSSIAGNQTQIGLMERDKGFRIFDMDGGVEYSETHHMDAADAIRDVEVSTNGYIFAQGSDSVYVANVPGSDPIDPTNPLRTFYFDPEHSIGVLDRFFLEGSNLGIVQTILYHIEDDSELTQLEVILGGDAGNPDNYELFNNKLYFNTTPLGMDGQLCKIYDLNDLDAISSVFIFDHIDAYHNDILYAPPYFPGDSMAFYDATSPTPELIEGAGVLENLCGIKASCESDRQVCHYRGSQCYSQLIFEGTTVTVETTSDSDMDLYLSTSEPNLINNGIIYTSTVHELRIVDACSVDQNGLLSTVPLINDVRDMAIKNDTLYIAYPSYVARYDVSHIEACTVLSTDHPEDAQAGFSVYPNPSDGNIQLEYTPSQSRLQITLRNVLGEVLHAEKISCIPGETFEHRLKLDQPTGLYLLEIRDGNEVPVEKLVLNKM